MEESIPFQKWMFPRLISFCVLFALGLIGLLGCGKGPSTKSLQATRSVDDPWQKALSALRKETDADSCHRILLDLNSDLTKAPNAPQPAATKPEDLAAATADYGLNEAEAKEISSSTYTALDAAYLAEVIYLRDVAVGLEVASLPPAKRAAAAFEWVCRQVVLGEPKPGFPRLPPLSPTYVLRRGSGSGLERAYVFVELCRQLNLDAYFVGPPEAKAEPAYRNGEAWHGPFWAVAVRVGQRVVLYDPWAGEALPFDLEQLRSQADPFAAKFAEWSKTLGVMPEAFRKAELFLALPLSSSASRWKILDEKLESERGAKLASNRETLLKNAANAAKGAPVGFWNAGGNPYSLTRTLAYTLCELEGGFAPNHPSGNSALAVQYRVELIPGGQLFPLPDGIEFQEPKDRIRAQSLGRYIQSFLTSPMPRERFQRGQFNEATRALVKEWEEYTRMTERSRSEPARQKSIADWIERANKIYAELNGAVNPAQRNAAENRVQQFWKSDTKGLELLSEQSLGPVGTGEAIYLLALCKQEFAERHSGPEAKDPAALSQDAREAWIVAHDWWKRYKDFAAAQNLNSPGREAHAAKLATRAEQMAGASR